jgi:hypothetical protein
VDRLDPRAVLRLLARGQIKAAGGRQGGDGLAIAGIVLGWVGAGTFLYVLLLFGSLNAALP